MFKVIIKRTVVIEGCPERGIPAIDFRRQNHLPEQPDNRLKIDFERIDEALVRNCLAAWAEADCDGDVYCWGSWKRRRAFQEFNYSITNGCEYKGRYYSDYQEEFHVTVSPALAQQLVCNDGSGIPSLFRQYEFERKERQMAWDACFAEFKRKVDREELEKAEAAKRAQEARELLRDELEAGERWKKDRDTLGEFLAAIPDDALRGTLKHLTKDAGAEALKALRDKVEKASPVTIFSEDDEESEESDE